MSNKEIQNMINNIVYPPTMTTNIKNLVYNADNNISAFIEKHCEVNNCKYFEHELTVFQKHCKENMILTNLGYINPDSGTINFNINSVGFDKGAVKHISLLSDDAAKIYKIIFLNSYKSITIENIQPILDALETKDSKKLKAAFTAVYDARAQWDKK